MTLLPVDITGSAQRVVSTNKQVICSYVFIDGTTMGYFGDTYHSGPISGAILQQHLIRLTICWRIVCPVLGQVQTCKCFALAGVYANINMIRSSVQVHSF